MRTADQYVEELFKEDADIEQAKAGIRAAGMPEISIPSGYGKLLTMLVRMSGAKDLLEIGALGGCSGIYLTRGLKEEGSLISLELERSYADVAQIHMDAAGLGNRVTYRIGDAKDSLAELFEEGRQFDFFFIDADKESYPVYLDWAIRLARPGAVIAGDNTMLHGRTLDPDKQGPSVVAMRSFNERMASDERLISTILPAYDGLALAVVK